MTDPPGLEDGIPDDVIGGFVVSGAEIPDPPVPVVPGIISVPEADPVVVDVTTEVMSEDPDGGRASVEEFPLLMVLGGVRLAAELLFEPILTDPCVNVFGAVLTVVCLAAPLPDPPVAVATAGVDKDLLAKLLDVTRATGI